MELRLNDNICPAHGPGAALETAANPCDAAHQCTMRRIRHQPQQWSDCWFLYLLRINAARVLRNLCEYSGEDFYYQLKEITAAAPTVIALLQSH